MSPARAAELIARYRHAATLAIAGAIALASTLGAGSRYAQLGMAGSIKYFVFVFAVVAIVLAGLFTFALVLAESRAEAQQREARLPVAIARDKPVVAPVAPAAPPAAVPPSDPERGPSILT